MQSISTAFTRAAAGNADTAPGVSVFWLMVLAIAILDDSERREKEQRDKRNKPVPKPRKRPSGPCPS
jgi:hypothetical protein